MAGYIEKKRISGKTYYYLTETKRVEDKWKKTRRYLGVHTPAGFEKPRREKPKSALSKDEIRMVEHIRKEYLKGHRIGRNIWKEERELFVSFIYNTNAIEGNSLSMEDTDSILLGKRVKAPERDKREVLNMKRCVDTVLEHRGELDEKLLLRLHGMEMEGILREAGEYRKVNVRVGNYLCPPWEDIPKLMERFFSWYREAKNTMHPLELAALAHLKLVRIHPFRDGNGRIARLVMNFILLRDGYPLLNIFNDEKMLYYLVLREVDAKKRSKPFVRYLHNVYVKQYMKKIKIEN